MIRLFILPFLLLVALLWVLGVVVLGTVKFAHAVVCFFVMFILSVAFIGFAKEPAMARR